MNQGITQLVIRLLDEAMRNPRKPKDNMVYLSPVLLWVGIVCTGIFLIPGLIVPLVTGDWESGFFLVFAAMSGSIIVAYVNCRIWYTDTEFTVKYFLGFRRTFSYAEIESIQGKTRDVKLKVRGCTVRVDELAVGKEEFLKFARKQYRIAHGGKAIPVVKKIWWDPFQGHVDNPGEFLVAYGLIAVLMPVLIIALLFFTSPTPMEDLTVVTTAVSYESEQKTDLVIYANDMELKIRGYRSTVSDPDAFLRSCAAGEQFTLGYSVIKDDDENITGYSVKYIADAQGTVWITPEDAFRYQLRTTTLLFTGFEIVWLVFCAISIYVGRNPHKFSKKVVRLFFKDGYVH